MDMYFRGRRMLFRLAAVATAAVAAAAIAGSDEPTAAASQGTRGSTLIIGLKAADAARGVSHGRVLMTREQEAAATRAVLGQPGVKLVRHDRSLPALVVRVRDDAVAERLRMLPEVDYAGRPDLPLRVFGGSTGCSANADEVRAGGTPIDAAKVDQMPRTSDSDFGGDVIPWNFIKHGIDRAWRRASGGGVTVAVVDTGIYAEQSQLRDDFAAGLSSGRKVTHINEVRDSVDFDRCQHGTHAASTVAAPFDGIGTVGVAWRSDLVAVKAMNGVVLDNESAIDAADGVRDAIAAGARVISMAFGTYPLPLGDFSAGVRYLGDVIQQVHAEHDVLLLGAAGSEVCIPANVIAPGLSPGVVFPASLPEVVAVTGLASDGNVHPDSCAGPEVDLAVDVDEAEPIAALGRTPDDYVAFGATSDAVSVAAGVAALVWSAHPTWNRDQVLRRLIGTGRLPLWSSVFDARTIDAYRAVGGFSALTMGVVGSTETGKTFRIDARPSGDGPFRYRWSSGETGRSITRTAGPVGTAERFTVAVTDTVEGVTRRSSLVVRAKAPPKAKPDEPKPTICERFPWKCKNP